MSSFIADGVGGGQNESLQQNSKVGAGGTAIGRRAIASARLHSLWRGSGWDAGAKAQGLHAFEQDL
jgi:hypothetical protein